MVVKCFVWRSQDLVGGMAGGQSARHAFTLSTTGVGQKGVRTNSDCVVFMLPSVSRSAVFIRISVDLESVRRDLAYICTDDNYKLVLMCASLARTFLKCRKGHKG